MSRRTERIGHVIQRELGGFILREISDPRIGFFTISNVDVSPDLGQAKVSISVLGNEQERANTLEALTHHANRMRSHLAKALHTRTVPKVVLSEDRSLEHGFRVAELLKQIHDEEATKPKHDLKSGDET